MGYAYSEMAAQKAALAMLARMDDLLHELDEPGGWALRLVQMLGDCRGEKLDEAMFDFLKTWVGGVDSIDEDFEIMESEGQPPEKEVREMGRLSWRELKDCESFEKLVDFPWRLWVGMAMPSRMDAWEPRLGERSGAELKLAQELSRIKWGSDLGEDKKASMCARAPVVLERMELDAAAKEPSSARRRPAGL
jgi:hypothetical protein